MSTALYSQFGGEVFATEFLLRFDLSTGAATMVNAGHLLVYQMRGLAIDVFPTTGSRCVGWS